MTAANTIDSAMRLCAVSRAGAMPAAQPRTQRHSLQRPITTEQVREAINLWQEFFEAPAMLREDNAERWVNLYTVAVNRSDTARRHWAETVEQVMAECFRFPMPVDVCKAADKVYAQHVH